MKNMHALAEEYVLEAYGIGSDTKNYEILRMLPATVEEVMEKLSLTKMPANRRLNLLLDAGLISWQKGTSEIKSGPFTKPFLKSVKLMQKYVYEHGRAGLLEEIVRRSIISRKT